MNTFDIRNYQLGIQVYIFYQVLFYYGCLLNTVIIAIENLAVYKMLTQFSLYPIAWRATR